MRVLIAEQDNEERLTLIGHLKGDNHFIVESISKREIIDHCRFKCPDILFIDEEVSGSTACDIIKSSRNMGGNAYWNHMFILANKITPELTIQAIESGADDILQKPINKEMMLLKIASAKRHEQMRQEIFNAAHQFSTSASNAVESSTYQDSLTSLGDARKFKFDLEKCWVESQKNRQSMCLMYIDLDYFQKYNDIYGTEDGNNAIRTIAEAMVEKFGDNNPDIFLYRVVGETFAILLTNADYNNAMDIAAKVRESVYNLDIAHNGSQSEKVLTCSVGLALKNIDDDMKQPQDLIESADFALYQAKHTGRNKVFCETGAGFYI